MNIKYLTYILTLTLANCQERTHPARFVVEVSNEIGDPISNATVSAWTFLRWEPGEGFGKDIADRREQKSDQNGKAGFDFPSKRGTFSIYVDGGEQFYANRGTHHKFTKVEGGKWTPDNPTITYILKRKLNPIPLYAKNLSEGLLVPEFGKKCGYDFKIGDWLPPHGKGQTIDIFFTVTSEQKQNGDFTSSVEVTFPNEKDGLIFFKQNPYQGSELTSNHLAPADGYQPGKLMKRFQIDRKITSEMDKVNGNYYLRVRTRLDKDGKIESAHYAKVYGDFMYFTYYFNPTPNDLNVEFDPKRNLFKGQDVKRP
jgi:hypothetical protein